MRFVGAAALLSLVARASGSSCAGVRVLPLASDGYETFPVEQYANLTAALAFNKALAFRVVTGFTILERDEISILSDPGDDAAAWSCALTDGGAEFSSFSGAGGSVKLPSGAYALTCDVIRAQKSFRPPVFSTRISNVVWTTCGEFGAVPPCILARQSQPWAEFGDGLVPSLTFTATVIAGSARLAALDVSVSSQSPGCTVNVSVQSQQAWLPVGLATTRADGMVTLTVPLDTLVSVTPAGVGMSVEASAGCQIAVSSTDPNTAVGDGAYGAMGDQGMAFVGSLRSVHACAKAVSTGRSVSVVTPSSTTAFVVRGWDPSTVARARVNLFARTTAQPKTLISKVLSGMLAIPDKTYSAHTFTINNIQLPSYASPIDPLAPFWDNIRSAIALGIYSEGDGDQLFKLNVGIDEDKQRLRDLVSLDLTNNYKFGSTNSLPVGVASALPSISKFLRGAPYTVEWYLNTTTAAQGDSVISVSDSIPAMRVDVLIYARSSANITSLSGLVSNQFLAYNASKESDIISIGTVFEGPSTFLSAPSLSMAPWIYAASGSGAWALVVAAFSVRGRMLRSGFALVLIKKTE